MNILVVNDDGIDGIGLHKLARALRKYGNVVVCAPDIGRSASSHAIILHHSLSFEDLGIKDDIHWYKTNGMPADCVRLSVALLQTKFDIVFSGVNNGLNLGTDIIYSGTVAAAREAQIEGIPAVAISTDFDCFDIVDKEIEQLLKFVFKKELFNKNYVLNVNFPTSNFGASLGYKICKQGLKNFIPTFGKDEQGNYVEIESHIRYDENKDTDVYLSNQGYITMVPLQVEQTNLEVVNRWKYFF